MTAALTDTERKWSRMSEDLIRRSDAIKAIASLHILADEEKIFKVYADNPHSMTTDFEGTLIDAINAIKSIPTIEPKRGEWLEWIDCEGEVFWKCSACGQASEASVAGILYKFCPFCGADMREREGE